MAKQETEILNRIRIEASKRGYTLFRNMVGMATAGVVIREWHDADARYCTIRDPYPVRFGLIEGSSDLIGWKDVEITPEIIGQKVAIFTGIEVKTQKGRLSKEQKNFIDRVNNCGGIAYVAKSLDDIK